jgi:hypothetical protein
MALTPVTNENSREAEPTLWGFEPRAVFVLMVGVCFSGVFAMILLCSGAGMIAASLLGSLPIQAAFLVHRKWIKDRPPGYPGDCVHQAVVDARSFLFFKGFLSRPPALHVVETAYTHPSKL